MSVISLSEFFGTYGFRTTFIATVVVGLFAGTCGALLYLRKQSLLSDVMGHSALLGVGAAFVVATSCLHVNGRSIAVLIIGATISSFLSVWLSHWITAHTPVGADTAMAVALALFYGGGLCLLHLIRYSSLPNRAGLQDYIFGNAATTRASDLTVIAWIATIAFVVLIVFWKEILVSIFDPVSARMYGFTPAIMHPLMLTLATVAIVTGIKSVGMILMVAFAILPAAICHQFCSSMARMFICSGIVGALAGGLGTYISICAGNVPSGPVVVLILFAGFILALIFSPKRNSVFFRSHSHQEAQPTAAVEQAATVPQTTDSASPTPTSS